MPKVRRIGTTNEGGILNVADDSPILTDPNYEPYTEPAPTPINAPVGSGVVDPGITNGSDVVTSTDGIRADQDTVSQEANQLITGVNDLDAVMNQQLENILDSQTYDESDVGQQATSDLAQLQADLGLLTPEQEQEVADAGQSALGNFAPLIAEAEAAKKQGLPKAIIAGGERGGFMNTQIAGGAALQTTEGGTFVGEGGELNRIKSVYDQNISNLKVQAENAKLAAEASAKQAIRTGKRQDFDLALRAADQARAAHNEAIQLANEKVNAISAYLSNQQNSDINIINTLQNIPEGETVTIGGKTYKGLAIAEIDPFFKSSDLVSIMKELPEGETKEITDPNTGEVYTLTGLATDDPNTQTFESEDASGNVKYTTIDKNTGEIIGQVDAGQIGKGRAPSTKKGEDEEKVAITDMRNQVASVAGDDGYISPADYKIARNAWVKAGLSPATFDKEFAAYRNPDNDDYLTIAE